MKKTYSNDPVIRRINENLDRIKWIMDNKKPYPKHSDPAVNEFDIEDLLKGMGGPFNLG